MQFEEVYQQLNTQQREAVDTLDGPVLVIAGPGTGKTQLLSARVAKILKETDTLPGNILCLTFTESGASNMRQRLTRFIGQAAYDVTISTYHALGGDVIRRYPEYFGESRLEEPVDELGAHQIISEIVQKMSYKNPLKHTQYHIRDLISTMSDLKKALLTPEQLKKISDENLTFLRQVNTSVQDIFSGIKRMPSKLSASLPLFESLLAAIEHHTENSAQETILASLSHTASETLKQTLQAAEESQSTKPLTAWKNEWLVKNENNEFVLKGIRESESVAALGEVLEQYQEALAKRGLYDFDDMILRSIQALSENNDFKYTLQEKYQYILLDEFQDTNAAQLKLVELLTDNPVHEGRPNILAVGDDDQAIYAFQGARYSNMLDFYKLYREVKVVNLTENYRSHKHILHTAHQVAEQVNDRLHHQFESMSKTLNAANTAIPEATIERHEFTSESAEYEHIAQKISELITQGVSPDEIAVLAPKHKYLEPLVGYLNHYNVPVSYEKRENILESPVVYELITMSRLLLAMKDGDEALANQLWPEVLSYAFWEYNVTEIWKMAWHMNDLREKRWSEALLASDTFRNTALLLLTLASAVETGSLEEILDAITGTTEVETGNPRSPVVVSPLKSYYTDARGTKNRAGVFFETITQLSVLRERLREYQKSQKQTLLLRDLISFTQLYADAELPMLNTSPYNQAEKSVQLMTVFKAKGLEFSHVFLPQLHDNVWGESSRGNSNRITLPKNVEPVRSGATTEDERLRIFFVALTRAKYSLHLSSHSVSLTGKAIMRLKYLDEYEDEGLRSRLLPENTPITQHATQSQQNIEAAARSWHIPHITAIGDAQLKALLQQRLEQYQLSPTHLNGFIDLEYGGPENFFFNTLLRFPKAPTKDGQFGNAIHETLEWYQHQIQKNDSPPKEDAVLSRFKKQLEAKYVTKNDFTQLLERGEDALRSYLQARGHIFRAHNKAEYNFKHENAFVGNVHLAGKIDYLEIDKEQKVITVVDYKTGKSYEKWASELKLHKYRQQLYCYKILVENSTQFRGYTVQRGRLEFIEPDKNQKINVLELSFEEEQTKNTKDLMQAVWSHIQALDLPDVSAYGSSLKDVQAFEQKLRESIA